MVPGTETTRPPAVLAPDVLSETRRPHPLGTDRSIAKSIATERRQLAPIRAMADLIINTSKFTVHELREFIGEKFAGQR